MKSFQLSMFLASCAILLFATTGVAEDSNNSQFDQSNSSSNENIENAALDDGLDNATPTDDLNELNENDENWLDGDNFESQLQNKNDFDFDNDGNVTNSKANTPEQANEVNASDDVPANFDTQLNQNQEVPDKELLEEADLPPEDFQATAPEAAPAAVEEEPMVAADVLPANEFSGAPPVPDTIRHLASGEGPEEYYVESGDTLFDICNQLIDEPAYWPKLWALNPEIKNPHFIYPDMRLAFYSGDEETPPYLQVVAEDDVVPVDKGDLEEGELIQEPIMNASDLVYEKDVEILGMRDVDVPSEILDGFILAGKIYDGKEVKISVPGFLYRDEIEPSGEVLGGREGEVSIHAGGEVLVESEGGVEAGSTYTVLRHSGEVTNVETDEDVGYRYAFVAHLKMEERVEGGVVIGRVTQSRLGVMPGDIVVSYRSTSRVIDDPEAVGSVGGANANIVGFSYAEQHIAGTGQLAFIDQGTGDGISPGMYIQTYSTPGFLLPQMGKVDRPDSYRPNGIIKIIDATDAGAVGYIVKCANELRLGDRAGKG